MKNKITLKLIDGSTETFKDLDEEQIDVSEHAIGISKVTDTGTLLRVFPMSSILYADIKEES